MGLADWQSKLEKHFQTLHAERSSVTSNPPIFALEHDLNSSDLKSLYTDIHQAILSTTPSKDHYLPWIVYAAEMGYQYAGDEYWQTFESATPGWSKNGSRHAIQNFFRAFHSKYGGSQPSGAWANHFSIICWPITHAILPQDLQRQFAKLLYELRSYFSAGYLETPSELGNLISAHSLGTTSRFQKFAQEKQLIGQIASALLLQNNPGGPSLILPRTLKRITEDLDKERSMRLWLKGAQDSARRISIEGLSTGKGGQRFSTTHGTREILALGIEPSLYLRPIDPMRWQVFLQVPDFSPLVAKAPWLKTVLCESRCMVNGSSGRWLARERFLYGPQPVELIRWPNSQEKLLSFENSPPELDALLSMECLLRPGPNWLFKIQNDGLAHEIRSLSLRPGSEYILLSRNKIRQTIREAVSITLNCSDIYAVRFSVPGVVTNEFNNFVKSLGLNLVKKAFIRPVGLIPIKWDGEGYAEWLTSEKPCIGIRADCPVEKIKTYFYNSEPQEQVFFPKTLGQEIYMELPQLTVGAHKLCVDLKPENGHLETSVLQLVIREPRPWRQGASSQSAFYVSHDPISPTLEDLWEGHLAIHIYGPESLELSTTVTLFGKDKNKPLLHKKLPQFKLGKDNRSWWPYFAKHFRDRGEGKDVYDSSYTCCLEFDAKDLGRYTLVCEREFIPIRWHVAKSGQTYKLKMLDDSGESIAPEVFYYSFEKPNLAEKMDPRMFVGQFNATQSGGMYVVKARGHHQAIIIPPTSRGFNKLGAHSTLVNVSRTPKSIEELLALSTIWAEARLAGDFMALLRQRDVLSEIARQIFTLVGGENWTKAEEAFSSDGSNQVFRGYEQYIGSKRELVELATKLFQQTNNFIASNEKGRVAKFSELLKRHYGLSVSNNHSGSEQLMEFVLRLASNPEHTLQWTDHKFTENISLVMQYPFLARAARFLVLCINRNIPPQPMQAGRLYSEWSWE